MKNNLAVGLVAGMALLLAGCGFSPMYGGNGDTGAINPAADLSNFDVEITPERTAQLVRNELLRNVPPASLGNAPYVLKLSAKMEERNLLTTSGARLRQMQLRLSADYSLLARNGKKPLTTGKTFAYAAYAVTREHLASEHARMQAEKAVARKVAEDIRRRLAIFFAQQRGR